MYPLLGAILGVYLPLRKTFHLNSESDRDLNSPLYPELSELLNNSFKLQQLQKLQSTCDV
jgi:hypothetical protein